MGIEIVTIASAACSAVYASKAANQNVDQGAAYQDPILAKRREADSAKCECCGSRQFVDHHAARICAYCRSEQ